MVGTGGLHVGLLPRIQVGTRVVGDAIGLPNLSTRIQIVDHPHFDLAANGAWMGSTLEGFDAMWLSAGVTTSVHIGRFSTHFGLTTARRTMDGYPTASPPWLVSLIGNDPLLAATEFIGGSDD